MIGAGIFITILVIILTGYAKNKTQETKININQDSIIKEKISSRDLAIEKYLLSQKDFSWQTEIGSRNACVFENLEKEDVLFPLFLWVYCQEFNLENGKVKKLSGTSGPIVLDYPNELSFFDLEEFTHQKPRDGSHYGEDIKILFSTEAQENIFNRSVVYRLREKMENKILSQTLPKNVITEEECLRVGGEIINTLGKMSYDGKLIEKIEGLKCPYVCRVDDI